VLCLAQEEQAVGQGQDGNQDAAKSGGERLGRTWVVRLSGPIRYRKFTALDGGNRRSIFYRFELPEGDTKLPPEVFAVLHEMKHLRPRSGHGLKAQFSGLKFVNDTIHGKVWRLNNDETGRFTSEIIDAKLADLAGEIDQGSSQFR
jgi:hypothetical protein